ncbi:MAG: hypothetical protein MHM6MM_001899 [Cercozoa sp. M6MM]
MSHFSAGIKLDDINDYLEAEETCVLETNQKNKQELDFSTDSGSVEIKFRRDDTGHFKQIRTDESTQTARITLDDCLACSGCVTSAETKLIEQQSLEQVQQYRDSGFDTCVISVSSQTRLSFAARTGLSEAQVNGVFLTDSVFARLTTLFKRYFDVQYVLDVNEALPLAQKLAAEEFVERLEKGKTPVLSGECPGWVCFAERHSSASQLLSLLSRVPSPQQLLGAAVKRTLHNRHVQHTCVMPCFDKKLEAARREFTGNTVPSDSSSSSSSRRQPGSEQEVVQHVDCVVTPVEIEQEMERLNVSFEDLEETPWDTLANLDDPSASTAQERLATARDVGGSNGYADFVLRYAERHFANTDKDADEGFNNDVSAVEWKRTKNNDWHEASVRLPSGKVKFVRAYGFRNIQNVVRKLVPPKVGTRRRRHVPPKWRYVEVMACPTGCLNGGAQLRAQAPESEGQVQQAALAHARHAALVRRLQTLLEQRPVASPTRQEEQSNEMRARLHPTQLATTFRNLSPDATEVAANEDAVDASAALTLKW